MARADAEALRSLLPVLRQLREIKGVKETQPGVFYARRDAFIHFHDEGGVLHVLRSHAHHQVGVRGEVAQVRRHVDLDHRQHELAALHVAGYEVHRR